MGSTVFFMNDTNNEFKPFTTTFPACLEFLQDLARDAASKVDINGVDFVVTPNNDEIFVRGDFIVVRCNEYPEQPVVLPISSLGGVR